MKTFDVTAGMPAPAPGFAVRSWFIDGVSPQAPRPFVQGLPASPQEFLAQLPPSGFSCWVRGTAGLVGIGRALRLRAAGPDRFDALSAAWQEIAAAAEVDNEVGLPGSGLIGFAALAFSAHSATASVIDIPRFVMGRRDGRVWLTAVTTPGDPEDAGGLALSHTPLAPPRAPRTRPGYVTPEDYVEIVARAVERLRAEAGTGAGAEAGADGAPGTPAGAGASTGGGTSAGAGPAAGEPLGKVVLARDEVVETDEEIDVRAVLGRLNSAYPTCWTFDVAGLVGATPELLIGVTDGQVTSRVLAGTYQVQGDPAEEIAAARAQLGSAKDSSEHAFAIDSLAASLSTVSEDLHVDAEPHLLQLATVIHLASDAHGTLRRGDHGCPTALEVARAVHPTAAVGGFPKDRALEVIEELEDADRGRFAGPVGWIDERGNGQFGIALRCGQLEAPNRIRLFAGAGIMPDSDPASELAETEAKLAPMKRALGVER
ncbi:isochorismate synthase MenF [Brevibacterium sp. CS2]|uniref:isochorismate synthase n=1 Tax=Brevibacterium sp. CS2 TaxID=2575923 RepID=UPI0020C80659|nr:isochorismate synthase [Brevibacterium sp. CS2]